MCALAPQTRVHTFKPHLLIRRLDQPEDHFASIHISQWKNISQIAHTRQRNVTGFMVNLVAGLVA